MLARTRPAIADTTDAGTFQAPASAITAVATTTSPDCSDGSSPPAMPKLITARNPLASSPES